MRISRLPYYAFRDRERPFLRRAFHIKKIGGANGGTLITTNGDVIAWGVVLLACAAAGFLRADVLGAIAGAWVGLLFATVRFGVLVDSLIGGRR